MFGNVNEAINEALAFGASDALFAEEGDYMVASLIERGYLTRAQVEEQIALLLTRADLTGRRALAGRYVALRDIKGYEEGRDPSLG